MHYTIDKNYNISMTRGDSVPFAAVFKLDGQVYELEEGDTIQFSVKAEYENTEYAIAPKVYHENPANILIKPEDTKRLEFGTYYYDAQFVRGSDGFTITFLKKKKFKILEEVT
jgi:hypothetical protein